MFTRHFCIRHFQIIRSAGLAITCLLSAQALLAQEHSYAPADIQAGQGVYQANCLGCHGNDGDAVDGADLSTGRFRYASSDEDLIRVIRTGIPDTPMPTHDRLSTRELRTVVAFLRSLPSGGGLEQDDRDIAIGNADRGEELFFGSAQCSLCHGVNGGGSRLSPDLAGIGVQRTAGSLQDSILVANAEVRAGNRFYRIVDLDGNETTGLLLNQSTHSVQMMNEDEKLVSFKTEDLSEHGFVGSPMPSYQDLLSSDQVADLVAYMLTLTGDTQ